MPFGLVILLNWFGAEQTFYLGMVLVQLTIEPTNLVTGSNPICFLGFSIIWFKRHDVKAWSHLSSYVWINDNKLYC